MAAGSRIDRANTTGRFELLYNPFQFAFMEARRKRLADGSRAFQRLLLLAGRRAGKTAIGAVSAVEEASVPNTVGWCVAPTEDDLHQFVIPAVLNVMPREWIAKWSEEFWDLELTNGSKIHFQHAENPERMRGPGLHWMWLDEPRSYAKEIWLTARPMLTEHRGVAWFTTTPNGFDWVYHLFWKRAQPGPFQRAGYWAAKFKTMDNPKVDREEVEDARDTYDELFFKQEYEADFVTFTGSIYGNRIESVLLKDEAAIKAWLPDWPTIPRGFPLIVGMDPGADHPFAGAYLLSTPKGLLVFDEYEERMSAYSDHAEKLLEKAAGFTDVRWGIDRSAVQAQIELAQHGITSSAAENNVWAGIQRVQSWMKTGQFGIIEARCPKLVEYMRTYRWAPTDGKDGEKTKERPWKVGDDLPDALRYAVMTWPELPKAPKLRVGRDPRTIPEQSQWIVQRMQRIAAAERGEGGVDWDELQSAGDFFAPTGDMFASEM
jgi:hypothetical protein